MAKIWTEDERKLKVVDDYFSSLSLAHRKIVELKSTVKGLHSENKWNSMSQDQKDNTIMEHIVPPKINKRYQNCKSQYQLPEYYDEIFPTIKSKSDVFDKDNDEHGFPFTWKTKSQMNLAIKLKSENDGSPTKYLDEWEKLKHEKKQKIPMEYENNRTEQICYSSEKEEVNFPDDDFKTLVYKGEELYSDNSCSLDATGCDKKQSFTENFSMKTNSSEKLADTSSEEVLPLLNNSNLPSDDNTESKVAKSGFDFLDNW